MLPQTRAGRLKPLSTTVGNLRKPRFWALKLLERLGLEELRVGLDGDGAGGLVEAWGHATPPAAGSRSRSGTSPPADRRTLQRYATDAWHPFELLLDLGTGLPSDNVSAAGERSRYTSPTNVGAYLWSTLANLTRGPVERAVRPLLAMEEFTAAG